MHAGSERVHSISKWRVIVPKVTRVRALAYDLVLRVVRRVLVQLDELVSLDLANHRYVIFHAYIIVCVNFMVALLYFLRLHVHQVYIRVLLTTILLWKVEIKRRSQFIHGAVCAVIIVIIKGGRACTSVATHEWFIRNERMVLTQLGTRLLWILCFAVLELNIIICGAAPPPCIRALPNRLAIEDRLWLKHVSLCDATATSPGI